MEKKCVGIREKSKLSKRKQVTSKRRWDTDDWNENECTGCGKNYNDTKKQEDWLKCVACSRWFHEGCSQFADKCDYYGNKEDFSYLRKNKNIFAKQH